MAVRDMLTALQALPHDAELLAFEAGWLRGLLRTARWMII